uniref:Filamentation induced by cAMP protein Fic n=2 Tax=Ralstonia solanacearum species complex TaxID=3116862 RepID=A0A0S4W9C2_RALSL
MAAFAGKAPSQHPTWSPAAVELARLLDLPMAARGPIRYRPEFVENYIPNESWLMPPGVSAELSRLGVLAAPRRIGAYADQVLSDLLVDLSWNSCRLEGNRYSAHAAAELLNGGALRCDVDTVMLLNHRAAVEFLADSVSQEGLSALVLRNVHAILMRDLVPDNGTLGAIRQGTLGIAGTLYSPMQERDVIEAMLDSIVEKAARIENPVEAALFLWIQLAYLQPFESGNERTSRLAANIPLLLHSCTPLTFQNVTRDDYTLAMLAIYELRDATLAADLASWTYQRSVTKWAAGR